MKQLVTIPLEKEADRLLRRAEAAEYVSKHYFPCAAKTLAKIACVSSEGPPFCYAGRFPLYPLSELDNWARAKLSGLVRSTSQARGSGQ